jgi:hypothetical protein
MSMGMIRLGPGQCGMGTVSVPLDSFHDPILTNTAADEAARAAQVAEMAKKASTVQAQQLLTYEAQRILDNAKALAAKEAGQARDTTVVSTGDDTGKILGMSTGTMLLIAGAVGLWVMGKKG